MGSNQSAPDTSKEKEPVYFNHAAQAPLTEKVKQAGIDTIQQSPWDAYPSLEHDQKVRELYAKIIGAENGSQIAIMPSTAFAISLAALNVQKMVQGKSGRILVLMDQMNSAVYPWQKLCDDSNGNIKLDIVSYPEEESEESCWTKSILECLSRDDDNSPVLAACLPPLHWSDGSLIDLEAISIECRKKGIPLIVDGTQAVGIMPCDVTAIKPTLLACSTHKWLRGPSGVSLVYISPDVHESWSPLDQHARGRDFDGVSDWDVSKNEMGPKGYPDKFFPDARKFDCGGSKTISILLPMIRASMEDVVQINPIEAQAKLKALIEPLVFWAVESGDYAMTPGPHAWHIVGIRPIDQTPKEVMTLVKVLQGEGIYISARCGALRISSYLTNTKEDVNKLINALSDAAKRL